MPNIRDYINPEYIKEISDSFYFSKRDSQIIIDLTSQLSLIDIGKKHELSADRIRQIAYKYMAICYMLNKQD